MSDNRPARVRGPVLRWARERWGVTPEEAAAALKVERAVIDAWEAGASRPTAEQAVRLSDAYNVALADLLRPEPPAEAETYDFRTVGGRAPRLEIGVRRALLQARDNQEDASYVAEELDLPVPQPWPSSFRAQDDADALARAVRSHFGLSVGDQLAWDGPYQALREWRGHVESLGVLVFACALPRHDCRGFSLWDDDLLPVIAFNTREAPQARIFTLLHELGHLIRRSAGLCDHEEQGDRAAEEAFCNRFAAATLMPRDLIEAASRRTDSPLGAPGPLSISDISKIASRMSVSRPAAAIRLSGLGHDAASAIEHFRGAGKDDETEWQPEREDAKGGPDFYRVKASRLGRGYAALILRGMEAGALDIVDGCQALGVTVDQVERLAAEFGISTPSANGTR